MSDKDRLGRILKSGANLKLRNDSAIKSFIIFLEIPDESYTRIKGTVISTSWREKSNSNTIKSSKTSINPPFAAIPLPNTTARYIKIPVICCAPTY
jgi:hypothetical protein